ncbi:MAG TPA: FAD binding domain-containing protein [Trebonia sp.]
MKAAPFGYVRPGSVADVVAELAAGADDSGGGSGGEVTILAGGQSLMPVLAMRLGRPDTLVDINAVPELGEIAPESAPAPASSGPALVPASSAPAPARESGYVRIRATVRQRQALEDPGTAAVPLLRMALPWVGHREIRGRGTVCGSLAHADPAAELPAVACCLSATMALVSARGRREVAAGDFFVSALTTVREPDELLESVAFPTAVPGEGFGFAEVARRHGDFALAGVAVRVTGAATGHPEAVAACFGVADRPVVTDVSGWTNEVLSSVGECPPGPAESVLRERFGAGAGDFAAAVVTTGDAQGSPGYRRHLIRHLVASELARATVRSAKSARSWKSGRSLKMEGGPA